MPRIQPASYHTDTFTCPVIVQNDNTGEVTTVNGDSVRVWVSEKGLVTVSGYDKKKGKYTEKVTRQPLTFLAVVMEGKVHPIRP